VALDGHPRQRPRRSCGWFLRFLGTVLVGDFSKAVVFDRLSLSVTLGTINDQFIRNMVNGAG
jgi:hypothetical protein